MQSPSTPLTSAEQFNLTRKAILARCGGSLDAAKHYCLNMAVDNVSNPALSAEYWSHLQYFRLRKEEI